MGSELKGEPQLTVVKQKIAIVDGKLTTAGGLFRKRSEAKAPEEILRKMFQDAEEFV